MPTRLASQPHSTLRSIVRLPSSVLLGLIALYQRTISPLLPVVTVGACACRFSPTCSHYAADAIRVHGAARGSWLALRRLVKCTPLHPGGFDPVPIRSDAPGKQDSRMSDRRSPSAAYSCDSVSRETSSAPRGDVVRWSGSV